MDAAMKPPGLLQGKFIFKKLPNGNLNKTKVVRTLCNVELVYCSDGQIYTHTYKHTQTHAHTCTHTHTHCKFQAKHVFPPVCPEKARQTHMPT